MQLRDTTQADILYLANHTVSRGCFKDIPAKVNYMYTLTHENEILGIGGIQLINETTAWAWIDATDKAFVHLSETPKRIADIYRIIRDYMKIVVELSGVHRLDHLRARLLP
ncbi:hypothetical protein LCGC14_2618740, partial [marine sediment metagenome]